MNRAVRIYRRLVRLILPSSTRRDAEAEMLEVFRDLRLRARGRGRSAVVGFWGRMVLDLVWTAVIARATGGERMTGMLGRGWRAAWRSLLRRPRERFVEAATLGLGVGAAILVAVLARDVLVAPLPYEDPETLVRLVEMDEEGRTWWPSRLNFEEWRDAAGFTRGMAAASTPRPRPVLVGTEAVRARVAEASVGFFEILGARLVTGRWPSLDEQRPGGAPVVLVSEAFWREALGAVAPGTTQVVVGAETWTVIGVIESSFGFLGEGGAWGQPELWLPMERDPDAGERQSHGIHVVARLPPGVALEQGDAQLDRMAEIVAEAAGEPTHAHAVATTRLDDDLLGPARRPLRFLSLAAAGVLLVAALNLAGTRLVHGLGRREELAVRRALGADRTQMLVQLLVEAAVVAFPAALTGVALAGISLAAVRVLDPTALPRLAAARLGPVEGAVAVLLAILVAMAASLLPAALVTRDTSIGAAMREARGGVSRRLRWIWDCVLASQVALTVALLVGAGLMIQGLLATFAEDVGYEVDGVTVASVSLPESSYRTAEDRAAWVTEALHRLRALPEVEAASVTDVLPHLTTARISGTSAPGRDAARWAWGGVRLVDPEYFAVLGIPVLRGGGLSDDPDGGVLIDRSLAEALFGEDAVVGSRVRNGMTGGPVRVAGLVGPVREWAYDFGAIGTIYLHYRASPFLPADLHLLVRTRPGTSLTAAATVAVLRAGDSRVPIGVRSLATHLAESLGDRRLVFATTALFALLGLLLAAVGIYSVVAYVARRRLHEAGIRIALGARPASVGRSTMIFGLRPTGWGAVLGAGLSLLVSRALQGAVLGTPPFSPTALATAIGLVVLAAVAAGWFPARHATRVDPVVVLREE